MFQSQHSAEHSATEHVALVDAIERGDSKTAMRLMEQHLAHVEQGLQLQARTTDLMEALGALA
jgi:DNA-binding FadR family transcriptional regulator